MCINQAFLAFKAAFSSARISRILTFLLTLTLLQFTSAVQTSVSYGAAGNVGSTTNSGTCVSSVSGTESVVATFEPGGFCLIKFNSSANWTVPLGVVLVEMLIVGGGGGGGPDGGGGGGGGEVRQITSVSVSSGNVATVTVGTGGRGGRWGTGGYVSDNGADSTVLINSTTYRSKGGGGGAGATATLSPSYALGGYAITGNSGSGLTQTANTANTSKGGRTALQNNGPTSLDSTSPGYDGPTTSFTGTSTTFAGGGGGGIWVGDKALASFGNAAGGAGGGGRGSTHTKDVGSSAGQQGTDGLGGGGGGGSASNDGGSDQQNQRTDGGRGGNGVVYIKYVPVVFLASDPQNRTGAIGDVVTFTSAPYPEISGPTRTKKWQISTDGGSTWSDISGATGSDSFTTPTITRSMQLNKYRYAVTDTLGTAASTTYSAAATLTVPVPQYETDTAMTSSAPTTGYTTVEGADEITPTSSDAFTIEAWIYPTNNCSVRCTIAAREGAFRLTYYNNKISFVFWNGGTYTWQDLSHGYMPLNTWSHVALVRNGTTIKVYINASVVSTHTMTYAPSVDANNKFNIGSRFIVASIDTSGSEPIFGSVDELKVWKSDRSASLSSDMNSNETSTANLAAYWNFNEGSGTKAYNSVPTASARTDFTLYSSNYWDSNVVSSASSSGVYTTRIFYRSIITSFGGWRVPNNARRVSVLVVGGGGGGGGQGYSTDPGGGGGGGGVYEIAAYPVTPGGIVSLTVGAGGQGGRLINAEPRNSIGRIGGTTRFDQLTAGGGGGATYDPSDITINGLSGTAGGGGGGTSYYLNAGIYGAGGTGSSLTIDGVTYAGRRGGDAATYSGYTGGGGGGAGGAATYSAPGIGITSTITGETYGRGGLGGGGTSTTFSSPAAKYGNGGDGYSSSNSNGGRGVNGANGLVVVKFITAAVPVYTKPTTAYLNVGMTETFTTNVAADSATVTLTRTFKWESTTPAANGEYTLIKQGTGAANAAFSWIPSDTSTSGSGYLYRLTVTDSDTAGLFITDSSTAYAVINRALVVSGNSSIGKAINLSKSETFTITLGTSTYRPTLTPVIPGITFDTSTAGVAVIKIADSMTVGTYYETLTVIDSVSASVVTPLVIKVSAPPNLMNTGEIVTNGLQLHLDAGNSQSLIGIHGNSTTGLTWNDLSGSKYNASTGAGVNTGANAGTACSAPTFSSDNGGAIVIAAASDNCYYTPYTGNNLNLSYTAEAWFKTSATIPAWSAIFAESDPNSGKNITVMIGSVGGANLIVGFRDSATWRYANCPYVPTVGRWTHISGTFDGSTMITYIDGAESCRVSHSSGYSASYSNLGMIIGKGPSGAAGTYTFPGSIGSIRIYNRPLTAAEIAQNYNATKDRFASINLTQLKPTKKYGVLNLESFTATSGGDTKTITFAVGDRAGIDWDTTTVTNRINISVQESLTVGTYYDTITVTDNLGQSTYLPITFTVTQADTLTITMGAPLTTVYTGQVAAGAPKAAISGLVGVDSATVLTRYDTGTVGTTCATGGVCKIGDTGPGGGKVFYVSDTVIDSATGVSEGGIYLEVAPLGWHSTQGAEEPLAWASDSSTVLNTSSAIGAGAENSRLIYSQLGSSATGFNLILNKTINSKSDWFVPSLGELQKIYTNLWATGLDTFTSARNMLSSTQDPSNSAQAMQLWTSSGVSAGVSKTIGYYMRPIRAFGGTTTTPVDVETYTAQGTNLTFSVGAASNYVNVVYETSTLKITQANQNKLTLNLYGAVAGSSFTLQVGGGSGSGEVTETVTAGSTALNCRISNHVLSNDTPSTEQKSCNISITKASSRNYKAETLTATVYFMLFANNQPTGLVGSGSTIAINGATSLTIDTTTPPSITGFSTLTLTLSTSDTLTINGTGFTGSVTIKFWRNKVIVKSSPNTTTLQIPFSEIASLGATSGRVAVITANGEAVSVDSLTINP